MSISAKIGCTPQTLNEWRKKVDVDNGRKPGQTTDMAAKVKALEREVRELRQANEPKVREASSCARRRRILPRRSSTARTSDDRVH